MSLDKQNWKNMLSQIQSMGADLLFQARPTAISRMLQAIQFPMDWQTNRLMDQPTEWLIELRAPD